MKTLSDLDTPAALVDTTRLARNLERMQARADALGVAFRPHVKTTKCTAIVEAQRAAGARGITVSTLKEAERFLEAGVTDILYAVGLAPAKLAQVAALRRRGCDLKVVTDNIDAARAIAAFSTREGLALEAWIEIDTDGHRSGVEPEDALLLEVGRALHDGGARLGGVMTHAGSSYDCTDDPALSALAERERAGAVRAAQRLRAAGLPCPAVSVGSTPTALRARHLDGVTELRAGVYALFDLVMHNVGVCGLDDIALSVLTTVVGHQRDKGWAIVDAGWMAMSRDRGTQRQRRDFGFGLVCDEAGVPLDGWLVTGANQEHGIVSLAAGAHADVAARFPVGTRLRILPNHACATGAQHGCYHPVGASGEVLDAWPRFSGW
jgi:D-serine deaminase-like pyridoxal phosphate-dependent protein